MATHDNALVKLHSALTDATNAIMVEDADMFNSALDRAAMIIEDGQDDATYDAYLVRNYSFLLISMTRATITFNDECDPSPITAHKLLTDIIQSVVRETFYF